MSEQKKSTAQSVLETIKKENVAPVPRWHFVARNIFVWVSGGIFLIAGALSVSLIIFALSGSAWQLRGVIGRSTFEHALVIMPFVWIGAFLLFMFGADYALRHTKKGYRYPLWVIALVIFVGSVMGGAALHAAKVSEMTDEVLGTHMPQYKTLEKRRAILMHRPDEGRIMGAITQIGDDHIKLQNHVFDEVWVIEGVDADLDLAQGAKVLVIGTKGADQSFTAQEVIVLPKHRGRHMREVPMIPESPYSDEGPREQRHREDDDMMRQHKDPEHEKPRFMEENHERLEVGHEGAVRGMHRERKSE